MIITRVFYNYKYNRFTATFCFDRRIIYRSYHRLNCNFANSFHNCVSSFRHVCSEILRDCSQWKVDTRWSPSCLANWPAVGGLLELCENVLGPGPVF